MGVPDWIQRDAPLCKPLSTHKLNTMISDLLRMCGASILEFTRFIDAEKFYLICHRLIDLLRESKTLEYVHDPNGVAVIGDIHGDIIDLLKSLGHTGWPTERTLIFLGDYVDRGRFPIQVTLLVFLLKLRYPQKVFLIRGNHETLGQCSRYGLIQQLNAYYPEENDKTLFYTLNLVFDHLPLAAIVSDQIFVCHGGISKFITCRRDISDIPRPARWVESETNVFQVTILTDLLWSDPEEGQKLRFVPSHRKASYLFNGLGLKDILKKLNCRALIRGHRPYNRGFQRSFDGLCYTVHSSKNRHTKCYMSAVILLDFDDQTKLVTGKALYHHAGIKEDLVQFIESTANNFVLQKDLLPMTPTNAQLDECQTCCEFYYGYPEDYFQWDRCLSVSNCYSIMMEYKNSGLKFMDNFISEIERNRDSWKFEISIATTYLFFLDLMIEKNVLTGSLASHGLPKECDRPDYDFVYKLPEDADIRWPFLKIED